VDVGIQPGVDIGTNVGIGAGGDIGGDIGVDIGASDGQPPFGPNIPATPGDGTSALPQLLPSAAVPTATPFFTDAGDQFAFTAAALGDALARDADELFADGPALEATPVSYPAAAQLFAALEAANLAGANADAAIEEAFRIDQLPADFVAQNSELLMDPSGLAAADLALQQALSTLSDLTRAMLNWFAMVGPAPFILMGLASLAALSEVARWRVQKARDIRRYALDW
jgi:hypothetical protein